MPGGWRREGLIGSKVDTGSTKANRCPQYPAVIFQPLFQPRVLIISLTCQRAAKIAFAVVFQQREIPTAVITHQQRFIVSDKFRTQTQTKQNEENP
ncbi:Uncharacterised protein [Shigella sonnei]|nr:Uncharacterised protein [Shigella sonnei]